MDGHTELESCMGMGIAENRGNGDKTGGNTAGWGRYGVIQVTQAGQQGDKGHLAVQLVSLAGVYFILYILCCANK